VIVAAWAVAAASLEEVLAVVAAALGAAVGLVSAVAAARQARQAAEAVERARSSSAESAIAAIDLQALGDYVYETLGRIPIAEYASNPSARRDVTSALEDIERFLDNEAVSPAHPMEPAAGVAAARRSLADGDVWQALARLRTAIEVDLRQRASRLDIDMPERAGAGRLLSVLVNAQGLPPNAAGPLRYAIEVANKAVHGEPVPLAPADEAIYTAAHALGLDR
jgi:hypothetical protein